MNIRLKNFFTKLTHWEYWNQKLIYAPLIPYYLWLSFKGRSFYFLTSANPSIINGGFIMESKNDVYRLMPANTYPKTLFFQPGTPYEEVFRTVKDSGIQYPLIAKPDIGERGLAVKKIHKDHDLMDYCSHMPIPYLIQETIQYPLEIGVFYCRYPGMLKGFITGIVNKELQAVTGDGMHTLSQLVMMNSRLLLQWNYLKLTYGETLHTVLPSGQQITLIPFGNHSRGCKFTDHSHRINQALTTVIDGICSKIEGFYFGRLDVRFNSWEELEQGKNFSIIELNGCGSEPTHIYDPRHSIFFAWREVIRHWNILYKISRINNAKGIKSLTLKEGQKQEKEFKKIMAQLTAHEW